MKVSIVLPTYNESKSLEILVHDICRILKDVEIVVVDDNSPDGTGRIADRLALKYNITVVHRKAKLGLGSAIVAGFRVCNGDIIGVMDADRSHPPEIIPKLLAQIEKDADLVIGSRKIKGGSVDQWSHFRQFISWGATNMARILTPVKDPLSGLFFLKKDVMKSINFKTRGYKILLEILVMGRYKNVIEVPYMFRGRTVGSSKLNTMEYVKYLVDWFHLIVYKMNEQ